MLAQLAQGFKNRQRAEVFDQALRRGFERGVSADLPISDRGLRFLIDSPELKSKIAHFAYMIGVENQRFSTPLALVN